MHLVDAGFIWTEPHSKRVKVKLTIQKEVRLYISTEIMSCDDHVTVRWWVGPFSSRYFWWSMWFIIRCVMNVTEDRPRISGELLFKSDRRYVAVILTS